MLSTTEKQEKIRVEMKNHSTVLDNFQALPKCVRSIVQTFHRSEKPTLVCGECGENVYASQLVNGCHGPHCILCESWDPGMCAYDFSD